MKKTEDCHLRKQIRKRWNGMKSRCLCKTQPVYRRYGGRGIKVCERWLNFENFYVDVLPFFSEKLSMDRIDNDGDYSPENVQWITPSQNSRKGNKTMVEFEKLEYLAKLPKPKTKKQRAKFRFKQTYRFTDLTVDKKVKLLKDIWKLKTEGAVIEKLIMDKKV